MEFVKLSPTEAKARKAIVDKIDRFLTKEHPLAYTPFVISHILSEGHETLKNVSDESLEYSVKLGYEEEMAAEKEHKILIMSPQFKETLLRAAVALCRNFDVFEILSFARTQFVF